jgi:hypothetical protein
LVRGGHQNRPGSMLGHQHAPCNFVPRRHIEGMCAQGLQRLIIAPSTGLWAHGSLPVCGNRPAGHGRVFRSPAPVHSISHTRSTGCNFPVRSQRYKRNLAPCCTNASQGRHAAGGADRH